MVVLEHINLVLLDSAEACQPRTTNKSHLIIGDNAGAYTTSHYLALLSHLEVLSLKKA